MQNKKYWLLGALLALVLIIWKILSAPTMPSQTNSPDKLNITASFYPLAYIAQNIGGNLINVTNITPPGMEPHDFEPSPTTIAKIYNSKLFIFNGGSIDAWAEKIKLDLETQGTATIEMAFETRDVLPDPKKIDPHLWLDPTIMSREADIIADALIKIDSKHAEEYNRNRDVLKRKLAELDNEYKSGLTNCQVREIVTSHDAFGYLANRYNFTTFHILGLSPEEDPSPKKIAEISKLAKSKNIQYIFFETMASPKLSQTIANEIGAHTLVLNPIEGLLPQDTKTNEDYISIMRKNLTNLKTAMVCQ